MASRYNLADLFETVAATVPERVAVIADDDRLTYVELNERADRLAAGLAAHGIGRGDKVGLYLHNGPAFLEGFIAACKLGAVPFNVNYRYRGEELAYLFANADAAAVIHDADFSPLMREVRGKVPTLKVSIAVGYGGISDTEGSVPYEQMLANPPIAAQERSEDDIILSYTGGTTGLPKGVMWPHRAFLFACAGGGGYFNPHGVLTTPEGIADRARDGYPLKMFPLAPLMHMAAMWAVWGGLLNGLTIVLDRGRHFDPERMLDTAAREGANLIQFVGDAMAIPLRDTLQANPGRWNLAAVVNLGSGGAVFSQHVKDELKALVPSANITDGMGASETGVSGMAEQSDEGVMRLPADERQQVVVDGRIAAVGETGFVARTGHTPVGYYNDPAKTAEVFQTIDGKLWAVSGDAARLDADRKITVFGRGSTCINTGGEKVFPEEVEEALRSHPAIFDAVVAGQADERWGERVVGVVAPRPGTAQPSLDEVKTHLAPLLAGYKIPRALVWVDAIQRSPAGKQDYRWAKDIAERAA